MVKEGRNIHEAFFKKLNINILIKIFYLNIRLKNYINKLLGIWRLMAREKAKK